ncbi:MAG TPA: DUF296 domain-containing protein [Polyangiaceae bacterium]|nr:DUF296 domain-containing protein [Polyangiaceae bacterium]
MKTIPSEKVRHLIVRAAPGETLPNAILEACSEHDMSRVWLRGSGVLADVVLRTIREHDGSELVRRIAGHVQLLLLEGSFGLSEDAAPSGSAPKADVTLRAVMARETDRGLDTLAGEIVGARIVHFEGVVTALDDSPLERRESPAPAQAEPGQKARIIVERSSPPPTWSEAIAASATGVREVIASTASAPVPPRPVHAGSADLETAFPDVGDLVDHFAFGRCEVLKSDGDRLHLRVGKDGRAREIALEMLRVQPLGEEGGKRRFRLERKL